MWRKIFLIKDIFYNTVTCFTPDTFYKINTFQVKVCKYYVSKLKWIWIFYVIVGSQIMSAWTLASAKGDPRPNIHCSHGGPKNRKAVFLPTLNISLSPQQPWTFWKLHVPQCGSNRKWPALVLIGFDEIKAVTSTAANRTVLYAVTDIHKADSPMRLYSVRNLLIKYINNVGKISTIWKIKKEK